MLIKLGNILRNKNNLTLVLLFLALMLLAFGGGWFIKGKATKENACISSPLRLEDFKFVKPLLICDTNSEKDYPQLKPLADALGTIIQNGKNAKNVDTVSVYFQDFKTDGRIDINKDEEFHAASMEKVSIMLAFYRLAESDPNILSQIVKDELTNDGNFGQEIKPNDYAKTGETYTVEELIEKMIKYSDNNSKTLLLSLISPSLIEELYKDIGVPLQLNAQQPENFDYITTRDISYFFRILYNSTYLTNDLSEKAMTILSEVDYKKGLVAGVPEGVAVAHKFGLENIEAGGVIVERELHDCGVIYHPQNPYLLCIMTKSSSGISNIEDTIGNISAAVYQYENSR